MAMDWSVFDGVTVGHVTDAENATGVTVLLFERGAVAGVESRGGATSTFNTDPTSPLHLVPNIHAVVLTGGSAFGLESVFGVMQWLSERDIGFDTGIVKVPIVVGAVIFDLRVGSATVRPTKEWGLSRLSRGIRYRNATGQHRGGDGRNGRESAGLGFCD
jgi:L-aminopeptidase/D-esterase-like protein